MYLKYYSKITKAVSFLARKKETAYINIAILFFFYSKILYLLGLHFIIRYKKHLPRKCKYRIFFSFYLIL